MTEAVALRVSCPDRETALKIARAAVGQHLAAAANISDIVSVYRWQGEATEAREARILFKTTRANVTALCDLIRTEHPYELPAITWHETETTVETANWLETETRKNA